MEYSIYDKSIQIVDQSVRDKFKCYEDLHLNKGRGFAVYNVSKLVLLRANTEYENFLKNQYGTKGGYIGKTFYDISNNNLINSRLPFFKKVIKTGSSLNINMLKFETVSHNEMFLEMTFIPIYENNKIKYIIESFTDVTERENQKAKILLFEKQKEYFLFICHEFKMPLTVILSAIQLFKLICKDELPYNCEKYIKKIKQASLQQLRLVNNLLDILKSDTGNIKTYKKNLDIVKVTKDMFDAASVFAITKGVNMKFSSKVKELIIGIDYEKYERIFFNLVSNAIKFTPSQKNIDIIIDTVGSYVTIEVKDEGAGISEDKLGVIFELFGQSDNQLARENEGTGIGLYLVKQLVNELDGKIEVTSKVSEGSSFILLIPVKKTKEKIINFSAKKVNNNLIESANIEFSNIYFD